MRPASRAELPLGAPAGLAGRRQVGRAPRTDSVQHSGPALLTMSLLRPPPELHGGRPRTAGSLQGLRGEIPVPGHAMLPGHRPHATHTPHATPHTHATWHTRHTSHTSHMPHKHTCIVQHTHMHTHVYRHVHTCMYIHDTRTHIGSCTPTLNLHDTQTQAHACTHA